MKHGKCLIIEPILGWQGHHLVYLKEIIIGASKRFDKVVVALPKCGESDYVEGSSWLPHNCGIVSIWLSERTKRFGGLWNDAEREFGFLQFIRTSIRQHADEATQIIIPYLDCCLYASAILGLPKNSAIVGITMRPTFHHSFMGVESPKYRVDRIKEWLFFRLIKSHKYLRICAIDPLLKQYCDPHLGQDADRLEWMPDPSVLSLFVSRDHAREKLGISGVPKMILVYGAIDQRKGIKQLLDAVKKLDVGELIVYIAGKVNPSYKSELNALLNYRWSEKCELIVRDKRIDEDEEAYLFSSCDLVWLGYQSHFTMSGVQIKTLQACRRSIVTRSGLLGWYGRKDSRALTINIDDQSLLIDALKNQLNCAEDIVSYESDLPSHSWEDALEILFT